MLLHLLDRGLGLGGCGLGLLKRGQLRFERALLRLRCREGIVGIGHLSHLGEHEQKHQQTDEHEGSHPHDQGCAATPQHR